MIKRSSIFFLLLLAGNSLLSLNAVGSSEYLRQKSKLLHEKNEYFQTEESFVRMMRLMGSNPSPGLVFLVFTSPAGGALSIAGEFGGSHIALLVGMQLYVLPKADIHYASDNYDDNYNGLNFFSGIDIYTPYVKIFGGVRVTDTELKSDAQIEEEAKGLDVTSAGEASILRPYLFINSDKFDFFQSRVDATTDLKRLGAAALLGTLGIHGGGAYDKADSIAGERRNLAGILRYHLENSDNALSEWAPHIEARYGNISETADTSGTSGVSAAPDKKYCVLEVNYMILAGVSYSDEKFGFRAGINVALPDKKGYFIATVQSNYLLQTLYGTAQNDWSIYGSLLFAGLQRED